MYTHVTLINKISQSCDFVTLNFKLMYLLTICNTENIYNTRQYKNTS